MRQSPAIVDGSPPLLTQDADEPETPARAEPIHAMALHDIGDGMVQMRYRDRDGADHEAELPAHTPMLLSFQDVLHQYFRDIMGAAAHHKSSQEAAAAKFAAP